MRRRPVFRMVRTALFAALLCVLSPLSVPLGAVPLSLGLFAVFLCGLLLPPFESVAAVALYLGIGALGLPVFSGFGGGIWVLVGPLGGYLWSYLIVVSLARLAASLSKGRTGVLFALLLFPLGICYLLGSLQYGLVTGVGFWGALAACVLPFLPLDLVKLLAAIWLFRRLR